MPPDFPSFLRDFQSRASALTRDANLAYFHATISGNEEDFARAAECELRRTKLYADRGDYRRLRAWKDGGTVTTQPEARALDVLVNAFLAHQIDERTLEEIVRLQTETERTFSTFRAEAGGVSLTDNEIEDVLKNETDSARLADVWRASKRIGAVVAGDVLRLVRLRNAAAVELGFANHHAMALALGEQEPAAVDRLFDELDALTRDAYAAVKAELDDALAARFHVRTDALMPWHYRNRFFQEAPPLDDVDVDAPYRDRDPVALARAYYASMGLPIDALVARSDLVERPGKYQHAYCTDIDREGDVRVVANVRPNAAWMNTLLHEFGHAVYDAYADRAVPWVLREPAHTLVTEAVAMLFGRFATHPRWLAEVAGVADGDARRLGASLRRRLRIEQLVFSRWAQVVYRFEKAMYEDPDRDLDTFWWDLVAHYQGLLRPENRNEPDWAAKIHLALYPAYYHNYLMGELLASQLHVAIGGALGAGEPFDACFAGRPDAGAWLRTRIFEPGGTLRWDDLIARATGERLTPAYYARQFVR